MPKKEIILKKLEDLSKCPYQIYSHILSFERYIVVLIQSCDRRDMPAQSLETGFSKFLVQMLKFEKQAQKSYQSKNT